MEWLLGTGLGIGLLVYIAFVFDLAGFVARDELWLRLLMLAASAFYLVYYYGVAGAPLWDAIATNAALAAVNLAVICVVVLERTTFSMSRETEALYRLFPMLNPGQFRRLLRNADRLSVNETRVLTREGAPLDQLYFVVEGTVEVAKGDTITQIEPGSFIGEIAWLTDAPASATVSVGQGTQLLRWTHEDLARLTRRSPALQVALVAHLNVDLARKVASSQPIAQRARRI